VLKTLTLQWIQQQPQTERSNMLKLLRNEAISQHEDIRIKWFAGNLNKNGQIFLIRAGLQQPVGCSLQQ
jgi:hypothetical protein